MRLSPLDLIAMPGEVRTELTDWLWRTGVFYRDPGGPERLVHAIDIGEGVVRCEWHNWKYLETGTTENYVRESPPRAVLAWAIAMRRPSGENPRP